MDDNVAGLTVSRETFARLREFESFVQRWNPAINLVSKSTLADFWSRHVVDSAQIFSHYPDGADAWVDLGSGGGLPGIVLAILAKELKPFLAFTLVEADVRKATFLRQVTNALDLPVTVLAKRIESVEPLSADVVSARALAPLPDLLPLVARHLKADGTAILPKGSRFADEIADARKMWAFDANVKPSQSDPSAAILVIRNIHRAHD